MTEQGVPTPAEEALAYRVTLMGARLDDAIGYAAMEEILEGVDEIAPGGKQRITNVIQALSRDFLTLMVEQIGHERAVATLTQLVSEKTLEAMNDDKENY